MIDHGLAPLAGYLAFAAAAIVVPGIAIQRLLGVRPDLALVVPTGTAAAAGIAFVALATGWTWVAPVALAALALALLWRRVGRLASGPDLRLLLPAMLAIVAFLALTQYDRFRPADDGGFVLDTIVPYDATFHAGLTWELSLGYPPQLPGVSGLPLGYHLGTDLVRAAALRWFGVHPFDSISRFDVTLWACALALALGGLAARLGASRPALALVAWTLLLTDFSFAFHANERAHWWADLLRGNLLVSLGLANPIVPALGLALGALIALSRHHAGEGRGYLGLAALLALATPFFKVFLGAHLLLGLGVAWLLGPAGRRRALLLTAVPAAVATAALVLGQGGQTVDVSLAPLDLVRVTREALGLADVTGPALWLWAVPWVVASLGLRILGLPLAWRALRWPDPAATALAAMALAAWPLGLAFRVSAPELLVTDKPTNDAAYLIEQGGPLLWVFAVLALAAWSPGLRRRPWLAGLAGGLALCLCLPATAQYVWRKVGEEPPRLPAAMVRGVEALGRATEPGDVVLQRPAARYPPAPLILVGRRVPFERYTPYLTQFASKAQLEERHATVYRFFRTPDRDEALEIARRLDARAVCLWGHDRLRFPTDGLVEPIHEEPGARCYRLPGPAAP